MQPAVRLADQTQTTQNYLKLYGEVQKVKKDEKLVLAKLESGEWKAVPANDKYKWADALNELAMDIINSDDPLAPQQRGELLNDITFLHERQNPVFITKWFFNKAEDAEEARKTTSFDRFISAINALDVKYEKLNPETFAASVFEFVRKKDQQGFLKFYEHAYNAAGVNTRKQIAEIIHTVNEFTAFDVEWINAVDKNPEHFFKDKQKVKAKQDVFGDTNIGNKDL